MAEVDSSNAPCELPECGTARGEGTMTTDEQNTDLIWEYLNAFNDRDHDTLTSLLADDVVEHGVHGDLHGPEEIVEFLDSYFETFPDYSGTTDAMVTDGDTVAVRYTARGTHSGEFHDIEPTAQTVEWTGMAMYRIEDEQIAEIWLEENRLSLLEQLEAVDPPAHLRL
jgi:steroid delta-isomerase-like uncharacterized protein